MALSQWQVLGFVYSLLSIETIQASLWWTDQAVDITEYERLRACVARNLYTDYLRGVLDIDEHYMLVGLGVPLDYKRRKEAEPSSTAAKESDPTVGSVNGPSTLKQSPQSAWQAVTPSQAK